jgi:hypothetical protein
MSARPRQYPIVWRINPGRPAFVYRAQDYPGERHVPNLPAEAEAIEVAIRKNEELARDLSRRIKAMQTRLAKLRAATGAPA